MEAPGFWDNPEKSQESMKTLKSLKDDVAVYQQLKDQYEEIELLLRWDMRRMTRSNSGDSGDAGFVSRYV